jgi:hypothetical protein
MELVDILAALSSTVGTIQGSVTVGHWLVGYIRRWTQDKRTAEVLEFLHKLGMVSKEEIQGLVKNWEPSRSVSPALRAELTELLTNLVRGARFHTEQGTPLSSYLRCERLIDQLLSNLQPKRKRASLSGRGGRTGNSPASSAWGRSAKSGWADRITIPRRGHSSFSLLPRQRCGLIKKVPTRCG